MRNRDKKFNKPRLNARDRAELFRIMRFIFGLPRKNTQKLCTLPVGGGRQRSVLSRKLSEMFIFKQFGYSEHTGKYLDFVYTIVLCSYKGPVLVSTIYFKIYVFNTEFGASILSIHLANI